MNKILLMISVTAALGSAGAFATNVPQALNTTASVKAVNFVANDIVPLYGKAFYTTLISFAKDENIQTVSSGDASVWLTQQVANNLLLVKSNGAKSNTNMTVVTDKHTYFFHLMTLAKDSKRIPTYAINFHYPKEIRARAHDKALHQAQQNAATLSAFNNPQKYNWQYTFDGDQAIMPLHVFDDGTFTYMQFARHTPQPSIFAVDNRQGAEAVVNVRRKGDYVIIQRTAPQFTLRQGKYHVASIFNKRAIDKLNK